MSVSLFWPSTRNSTRLTPTLSEALAATLNVPDTAAPLAGEVIETDGALVSGVGVGVGVGGVGVGVGVGGGVGFGIGEGAGEGIPGLMLQAGLVPQYS